MFKYLTVRSFREFAANTSKYTLQNVSARRQLHTTQIPWRDTHNRTFPMVYYYQNPLDWLKIKWQLLKLKKWDRDFNENDFFVGSTYAISSVTHKIRLESYNELEGLLTPIALSKLKRDILVLWNDDILRNIALKLTDIKLAVPTKVQLRSVPLSPAKLCDIDMWYMAMKWQDPSNTALLIIDVVARFNRDFNHPDWTISFFELRKYHVQNYNQL
ncbi:uncharacterized protein LOC128983415 [Macrosteles quadrilineatus]|uniref:uncharacterized protein LOC128983415 n=1 Tax=Macrosteles quadrilineatus TaxID=74068 RepID=UPI0023E2A89C|nr:uncharacterized protein LOC128983415 [Macrosteles quadrilineatus]